jgi:BTB/POZ domain-containing protein KCTD9
MRNALVVRAAVIAITAVMGLSANFAAAHADDMVRSLDLKSDEFTKADMSRADIEAGLAALKPGETLDLSGKRLNGLDLSGMDLTRTRLQATRLNNAKLKNVKFDGVVLDAAWALKSDFSGASFAGASLFQTQMMDCMLDGADFSSAMVGADMSRASLLNARFENAMLAPDLTNQSMGLMRGVLTSAKLDGATFKGANLTRSAFEFSSLKNVNFEGANLTGAELGGADMTGANIAGATFENADVDSTKLLQLKGKDTAKGLDKTKNTAKAITD